MQRRASSHVSAGSGDGLNGANGTGSRPVRRVRKRRKKSAFRSHYGREGQEILLLVFLGVVLVGLASVVLYKVAVGSSAVETLRREEPTAGGAGEALVNGLKKKKQLRPPSPKLPSRTWWQWLTGKSGYIIPGSMSHIGDKSPAYAALRIEYEQHYPDEPSRSRQAVLQLHKRTYQQKPMDVPGKTPYDIHDCPMEPPVGYPYAWNIMDVLNSWPPDDPTPRSHIYQGLCVFDFEKDLIKAMNYRTLEKPFVVRNDPEVAKTVERWNSPQYMERLMGNVAHRTEYSENNHFMYWTAPRNKKRPAAHANKKFPGITKPANWTAPTKMMRMPYEQWLEYANVTDEFLGPDQPHWYYRLIGCGEQGQCDRDSSEYLFDELTFFQPKPGLYLTEPDKQKGIHCRFGMKGVIAENHFDGSRNSIVVLGGARRYILSHPDQCERLALLPKGHPSARHSAIDWSDPDLASFPQFKTAETNEVVLQPGDVLYLPTNWFHYIISLELNYQCNTRSGISQHYMDPIHECGF